jgi:hypothetical protein
MDITSLIGLTLEELIFQYGVPQAVHPVRGVEIWQDDVVFAYQDVSFYVYQDRVWQIEVKAAYGIKNGDHQSTVFFNLGSEVQDHDEYLLCPLPGKGWPLMLRVNFTASRQVSAIYIFRTDF